MSAVTKVIEGTHAISYAVQRARARVIAAYPITPSSGVVELLSEMCGDGRLDARFVAVESEHSALATCAGASQTGLRAFTATSSHGLAYMHEMLHWCAGARLPIVLANVNRAMGSPWNIFVDQNDSLSQRDTGWIQFYCENNQEVLDTVIQAFRVAEHVLLPAMVNLDAFFLSHTSEPVSIPDQALVDAYLPEYRPAFALDTAKPSAFGGLPANDAYMELRARMERSMDEARKAAIDANEEFYKLFGRRHPIVETYPCNDDRARGEVDIALVTSGTAAATARSVIDQYQKAGKRVRLVKIRLFRPFPFDAVRAALSGAKKVVVFDRNISFGHGGIMASEVRAALHSRKSGTVTLSGAGSGTVPLFSFVGGLGGRDVTPDTFESMIAYAQERDEPERETLWVGLKEK
ncbi:MAG: pyruvate ferredoxin oxidoreductase [Acidobacteria bacterium]|nr:pyruvate ferredoxin oxidoreductase [Acidobacteriota bacterium]